MKLYLILSLFLLSSVFSIAQLNPIYIEPTKEQADSLKNELEKNINDTLRMSVSSDLAVYYIEVNLDSALIYSKENLRLAQKLQLKLWEAEAYDLLFPIYVFKGDHILGLQAYNEALKIAENKDSEKNIWKIGRFTNSNNPVYARLNLLGAIQLDGVFLYNQSESYDEESLALQKGFETASRINDDALLSRAYRWAGTISVRNNKLDSALYFFRNAIEYSYKAKFRKHLGLTYSQMGDVYMKKNLLSFAFQSYKKAIESDMESRSFISMGKTYLDLAEYYNRVNKNDSAFYFAKLGLALNKNSEGTINLARNYTILSTLYKNTNKLDSAFWYLQLATVAKDSLLSLDKVKQLQSIRFNKELQLQEIEKEKIESRNKTRTYFLLGGLGVFLVIGLLLYRNNRQKQKAKQNIEKAYVELKTTQKQLIQSEKMASLGELTAGIAHEIQNPLNFVNNFSEVNTELISELVDEVDKGNTEEVKALANDIKENSEKINHHGKRAGDIVKGMLQHSRKSEGKKEPTDINALCDEYLRLAYHGLRAKDKSFNAEMKTDFDSSIEKINIVPQDIGRVILNLINNAFYAVSDKQKAERLKQNAESYEPTVTVKTLKNPPLGGGGAGNKVLIIVRDNGPGIPKDILDKIFQPFFTTKPTGQGTGLGLSLSYDIVKAHGGEIKVESKEGAGTGFIIQLPIV